MAFCGVVDRAYEWLRKTTSGFLRRSRFEYAEAVVRLGRRRRLIVSTVLTGAPGARQPEVVWTFFNPETPLPRRRLTAARCCVH